MDPITVFTVFLKLAAHTSKDKIALSKTNLSSISRTEIIEIYRRDMENNFNHTSNKIKLK